MAFGINAPQSVLFDEAFDWAGSVFPSSAGEIVRHANVKRAVGRFVMIYTHPPDIGIFFPRKMFVGGRVEPGHER